MFQSWPGVPLPLSPLSAPAVSYSLAWCAYCEQTWVTTGATSVRTWFNAHRASQCPARLEPRTGTIEQANRAGWLIDPLSWPDGHSE